MLQLLIMWLMVSSRSPHSLHLLFCCVLSFLTLYNYYYLHWSFSHQHQLMVFHWSLSGNKSSQVLWTLLSILAVLNNVVVWMVSTSPPTSKSSSPFSNPLVTVPKAPITIGIIVTFMFHCFFNSLGRSRYLSFFSHSFSFTLWSPGTAKSTILQVLFFLMINYYYCCCYYSYYCYHYYSLEFFTSA